MFSRRRILEALFGYFARPSFAATQELQVDRTLGVDRGPATRTLHRQYRADAVVLLLGIPLLRRAKVGSGTVSVQEWPGRLSLRFAAGSLPEQARGLNRLGYLHEVILEDKGTPQESAYFGFITANPEESLAEARKTMGTTAKGDLPYTVIDASSSGKDTRSCVTHLFFSPKLNWSDITKLMASARVQAHSSDAKWRDSKWPGEVRSFLYVVRQAILAPDGKSHATYVYAEKRYSLAIEKVKDETQGNHFKAAGLAQDAGAVRLLKGEILNESTHQKTQFQLWAEQGSSELPLPLRIEFQPRSYLRLTFEWDRTVPPVAL